MHQIVRQALLRSAALQQVVVAHLTSYAAITLCISKDTAHTFQIYCASQNMHLTKLLNAQLSDAGTQHLLLYLTKGEFFVSSSTAHIVHHQMRIFLNISYCT